MYRCPYCHTDLGPTPRASCPSCGKVMVLPSALRPASLRERRRAKEKIQREADQARRAIGGIRVSAPKRSPLQLAGVVVVLLLVGGLVLSATRHPRKPTPSAPPRERAQSELNVIRAALELFRLDCGRYPDARYGLTTLISNPDLPGWLGPYVSLVPADPWGQPYRYTRSDDAISLHSSGPDTTPDTPDDLAPLNWESLLPTPTPPPP